MLKKIKILSIVTIMAMALNANDMDSQQAEITASEVELQNSLSDASAQDITPQSIEDFFDEFKNEQNIEYGQTKDGKTFYSAKAITSVSANDADFAKSLVNAYNKAFLDIQANYIRDSFGRQSTETLRKNFTDNSTNAKEFEKLPPESIFSQLLTKISELAGAKLDDMLSQLGVDIDKGLSTERKKVLLAESLVNNMKTTAMGEISGLVPIQTAVTKDGSTYDIGVIAIMSEKTVQIARDMKFKRKSIIKGNGKKISEFLPTTKDGFLDEFGIRLVYDENGSPVILSYGRWGYVKNSSDEYINKRQKDIAQETASQNADSAIGEFISLSLSLQENKKTGEEIEHAVTQLITTGNIQESEKVSKSIIDQASSEIRSNSSINLKGIRTLKRWSAVDKNGIEHVGVVRFYSYANVENTNDIIGIQSGKKSSQTTKQEVKKSQDVSSKSKMVNDLDDF
ncbi:DUF6844 domain-containing protein [Campylobacter ureolyticus]|uniref:DUF6844 domain-containing protein n=1 Tax=Campylobacter ureolyticus TaxID=827 RepID=UPI0026EDFC84|nr:hypothetical protein [Campylobacter ureolyticus]